MASLTRVHGTVLPGAFYGYQPLWVRVAGTGIGAVGIDGVFERAVKAVETVAAVVVVGTPAADAFMVIVDATTASLSSTAAPGSNDKLIAAILGATSIAVTVTTATDLGSTLPA